MRWTTALFDLDGTLTDPEIGICRSVMYALEKAGLPVRPLESYHRYIGPPLLHSFQTFEGVTPEEAKMLLGYYRERFSTVGLLENEVYPGIPELLRDLKERGVKIAVATGKPTVFSRQILEHFGLIRYIDFVSGISLTNEPLDKHQTILKALCELGVTDKASCVMTGDRSQDAVGAKKSGVDFIGILYGYGDRPELEGAGARRFAGSVNELRSILFDE